MRSNALQESFQAKLRWSIVTFNYAKLFLLFKMLFQAKRVETYSNVSTEIKFHHKGTLPTH
jgi:hypothetical protein